MFSLPLYSFHDYHANIIFIFVLLPQGSSGPKVCGDDFFNTLSSSSGLVYSLLCSVVR